VKAILVKETALSNLEEDTVHAMVQGHLPCLESGSTPPLLEQLWEHFQHLPHRVGKRIKPAARPAHTWAGPMFVSLLVGR
jgi:hypothetical protein